MNTQIVPEQTDRTRDMGVSDSYGRPPYAADRLAQCLSQLSDLHRWFGTSVMRDALNQFTADEDYQARVRGIDPEQPIRNIDAALRGFGDPEAEAFADRMEMLTRALPVATPFPGLAVA